MRLWDDAVEAMRPEARQVVADQMAALRDVLEPEVAPSTPAERVAAGRALFSRLVAPAAEGRDRTIAGVRCRVFLPEGTPRAVYLHFHGGGMVLGLPELNDLPNRDLARRHQVAVVSVDYRLAPEHPWPAGPEDGLAVARWLLAEGKAEFGTDRLLLGGESAGGYMAAAVLLGLRDPVVPGAIVGVDLVFGVFDWGGNPSQHGVRPSTGPDILNPEEIAFFSECYLPGKSPEERRDPGISPAAADLSDLPPALFSVGTADHLLDDTLTLAGRWAAAGNETQLWVGPDLPHAFLWFPCAMTADHARVTAEWIEGRLS
jgi:acetyl esterase/lipase